MKHTGKILAYLLCLCLLMSLLCACKKKESAPIHDADISVFASFYPLYAAAQMVTENVPRVNLNCLVQPQDGCLRSYQLSDWDLALLTSSDLVITGGCGLESFETLLYALGEDGPAVAAVLYNLDLISQPAINTQEDTDSHWQGPNPHIYMRTDGMMEITQRIAESMILLDPENEALYQANLQQANEKLHALASDIKAAASDLSGRKVIVMNEALVYSAQEFELDIDLCYERESGSDLYDTDLSDCLQTLSKSDAKVILIEKQAPQKLCKSLMEAGYQLARMDVLSTRRANEGSQAYFDSIQYNIQSLENAFKAANSPSEANNSGGNP